MTYEVYSEQDGQTLRRGFHTVQQALLFMGEYDSDGTIPFLVRKEEAVVDIEGEIMLTPTRSALTFTVQIQTNSGWQPYIHTDDMEDALETMEAIVHTHRSPSRVIENENANIVQEKFPYFNDHSIDAVKDFDWRKEGF